MVSETLKSSQGRRRGVFDGVAVLAASPVATFLTLLLELLLSLGVSEAETESDAIMVDWEAVKVLDDPLSDLP